MDTMDQTKEEGQADMGEIGGKVNHIAEELKMFYLGDQFFLGNKCKRSLNQGMLDAKISLLPAKIVIQLLVLVFNILIKDGWVCVCEDLEVVCQLLVEPSTNQPTTKSDSRDQLHQSFISSTILHCQNYKQWALLKTPRYIHQSWNYFCWRRMWLAYILPEIMVFHFEQVGRG